MTSPPDLERCCDTLKAIINLPSTQQSPKHIAQLYVAAVGLLYHLKIDHQRLLEQSQHGHDETNLGRTPTEIESIDPSGVNPNEPSPVSDVRVVSSADTGSPWKTSTATVPAITAVIQDANLFSSLLRCLSTTAMGTIDIEERLIGNNTISSNSNGGGNNSNNHMVGRKRSLSFSTTHNDPPSVNTTATKMIKLNHHLSPIPSSGGRKIMMAGGSGWGADAMLAVPPASTALAPVNNNTIAAVGTAVPPVSSSSTALTTPTFSLPVVAAVILQAAFQPFNHWPAPLVRAYADDTFGPRSWVDDPRCQAFVSNLMSAHANSTTATNNTSTASTSPVRSTNSDETDAARVVEAYRNWHVMNSTSSTTGVGNGFGTSISKQPPSLSGPPQIRRGSASSTGSSGPVRSSASSMHLITTSHSMDEEEYDETPTRGHQPHIDDSDSGEEEVEEEQERVVAVSDAAIRSKSRKRPSPTTDEGETVDSGGMGRVANSNSHSRLKGPLGNAPRKFSILYPLQQLENINLERVRQRYFGANLEVARSLIASSLQERLDYKSKQNLALLQALPLFTTIPRVRSLVAANLSKWLQSPALASLARALFTATVNNIENADPPLLDDLSAIESILSMNVKANQMSTHIENITAIARRIPTNTVIQHIYSRLLSDASHTVPRGTATESLNWKMIKEVHQAVPPQVSYEALASILLVMLVDHQGNDGNANSGKEQSLVRSRVLSKIRGILRSLATEFGSSFDACQLIDSFCALAVRGEWSARDEVDKARLMYHCVTLSASAYLKEKRSNELTTKEKAEVRQLLMSAKKILLTWCCVDYGPHFSDQIRRGTGRVDSDSVVGAGLPDFHSALGCATEEKIPQWLNTIRCLLFIEDADSELMQHFINPDGLLSDDEPNWDNEMERMRLCCEHGRDLNDDLFWVVIKASHEGQGLDPVMSIQILENLVECCGRGNRGSLKFSDPMLVWEMYSLAQYRPSIRDKLPCDNGNGGKNDGRNVRNRIPKIPRLAYPGLWWRVTIIALIMCGHGPEVGSVMWKEHPTLRALVKMVTSMRFRFPTVDCDDLDREMMKQKEQEARDEESRIAEFLLLPAKEILHQKNKTIGSRVSKRLQKQQQERDQAMELAENSRRKKMLRTAQKSIMLWDPDGAARKPPREAAELLLSVEELFDLASIFQRSTNPDYLSLTIGDTTRAAVERAYDWLIPVVSKIPSEIVRLQSSTSCFLLLRVYGTDGEERNQLKELASPLLRHVQESLSGKFGVQDCVRAFELLMVDFASQNPDRRRCARRVLHDALQPLETTASKAGSWMLNILQLDYAKALVPYAVKFMSSAAGFERGNVLRSLVIALQKLICFAKNNNIYVEWEFASLLVDLISRRPSVYAEALDGFLDLRSLAVAIVHSEFHRFCKVDSKIQVDINCAIELTIHAGIGHTTCTALPISLIRAITVLISIWKDAYRFDEEDTSNKMDNLVSSLLRSDSCDGNVFNGQSYGLASAKRLENEGDAVSVEMWIMLAKARSDSIARRVALSAPVTYLPRLLLCSGLPRASLLTMIDRLGLLGESALDMDMTFRELLAPSASSQWDIGRMGQKKEISRKLLGRLSAYARLFHVKLDEGSSSEVSTTFLKWLANACIEQEVRPKGLKFKRVKLQGSFVIDSLPSIPSFMNSYEEELSDIPKFCCFSSEAAWASQDSDTSGSVCNKSIQGPSRDSVHDHSIGKLIQSTNGRQNTHESEWLAIELLKSLTSPQSEKQKNVNAALSHVPRVRKLDATTLMWELLFSSKVEGTTSSDLVLNCIRSWSPHHIRLCRNWIRYSVDPGNPGINVERVAEFLLYCSREADEAIGDYNYYASIAVECLLREPYPVCIFWCRNSYPVGLSLGLLTGDIGDRAFQVIWTMAVEAISTHGLTRHTTGVKALLLHLYLQHPQLVNSASIETRHFLVNASDALNFWWTWRSSSDDRIQEMIDAFCSGNSRAAKMLSEWSRKHPLLVIRKSSYIVNALERDGRADFAKIDGRGTICGQDMVTPRVVTYLGRDAHINIRYWGCTYTESIWVTFLDILMSAPREVLFGNCVRLGLLDLACLYLKLIDVQVNLTSHERSKRLKAKFVEFCDSFRQYNSHSWVAWLACTIEAKEVRLVMLSCGMLSADQARDSLRSDDSKGV